MLNLRALRRPKVSEDFVWIAMLDDGSAWHETGPDGRSRGWASIPAERRVVAIALRAQRPTHHDLTISIPDGADAVFFRRRRLTVRGSDHAVTAEGSITVAGWKTATDARYWAIAATGDIRVTSDLAAIG